MASKEGATIKAELDDAKAKFTAYERKDIKFREDLKHNKALAKKLNVTAPHTHSLPLCGERSLSLLSSPFSVLSQTTIKREAKKIEAAATKAQTAEEALPELSEAVEAARAAKASEEAKVDAILEEVQVSECVCVSRDNSLLTKPPHTHRAKRLACGRRWLASKRSCTPGTPR